MSIIASARALGQNKPLNRMTRENHRKLGTKEQGGSFTNITFISNHDVEKKKPIARAKLVHGYSFEMQLLPFEIFKD